MAQNQAIVLPSTPSKRPSALDFDSIIRIKVGKHSPEIFEIHKGVLRFYSGYFRKAIENVESGRFAEAEDNMITLPAEEPDVFHLFQGWIYTRELPKDMSTPRETSEVLIKLWCLGDRRTVPLLQNEAIDCLRENTLPDSALRRFMIASFAARCGTASFKKDRGSWPAEAVEELVLYMLDFRPRRESSAEYISHDMCTWHVHEEGARCTK